MAKKRKYIVGMGGVPTALPAKPKKTGKPYVTKVDKKKPASKEAGVGKVAGPRTPAKIVRKNYAAKPVAERQKVIKDLGTKGSGQKLNRSEKIVVKEHNRRSAQLADLSKKRYIAEMAAGGSTPMRERKDPERFKPKALKDYQTAVAETRKGNGRVSLDGRGLSRSSIPGADTVVKGLGKALAAIGVATYKDPVGVPTKTAKQAVEIAKATPGGVVKAVTDPVDTAKEGFEDYSKRSKESFGAKVKRIRKEGAASDALDLATVAPVVGTVAKGAAIGKVGRAVQAPRPAMRVGGQVKKQRASNRLGVRTRQLVQDKARARKMERQVQRAENDPTKKVAVDVAESVMANRQAGRVVEVVPTSKLGRNARRQRLAIAKTKSRAVMALKTDSARTVGPARRKIAKLKPAERKAFYYASALGVRTPAQATELLAKRRAAILAERAGVEPKGGHRKVDELNTIDEILADPAKFITPRLGATVDELRPTSLKAGREDPTLRSGQRENRRFAQQAEVLGMKRGEGVETQTSPVRAALLREIDDLKATPVVGSSREAMRNAKIARREAQLESLPADSPAPRYFDESMADFNARVSREAESRGMGQPQYFRSERYDLEDNPNYAAYAAGGARAVKGPRPYTGKAFRQGLQDTKPETYLTGLQRNIKRKHNHKLIADTMDKAVIKSFPGGDAGGAKLNILRSEAVTRQIDSGSMAYWNPGIYRKAQAELLDEDVEGRELKYGMPGDAQASQNALGRALITDDKITPELAETSGWYVLTKTQYDEIMQATNPSNAYGRAWDIAKGKQSAALLLAGNVPWMTFQIASNALQALGATSGRAILDMPRMLAWKRRLPEDIRNEFELYAGSSPTHDASQNIKLGAAANNAIVNGYRTWKAAPVFHKQPFGRGPEVSQIINPLEWFRTLDRKQTDLFRETVLYNKTRQEALGRMTANLNRAQAAQGKIARALELDPNDGMAALLRDRDAMEDVADSVNEFMGDYLTYTARERKFLNRYAMFYGYLRFSLRFAFYTMPVQHPVMTGILGQLGQLQREEIIGLLGGEDLPWNIGKIYFTKDGELKSIDLSKANPAINALTQMSKPTQVYGMLPPIAAALIDQTISGTTYGGKAWKINESPANPFRSPGEYDAKTRATIFADDLLSTLFPYRTAENLTQDGPQGDDSTLWDERETSYSDRTEEGKQLNKMIQNDKDFEEKNMGFGEFMRQLVPLLPRPSRAIEQAEEQKVLNKLKDTPAAPRKKAPPAFGTTSSGNENFGASPPSASGKPKYFGTGG